MRPDPLSRELGAALSAMRRHAKLSRYDLALDVGLSHWQIARIERGQARTIKTEVLRAWSQACGQRVRVVVEPLGAA